jgi:hypothetical protein
MILSGHKCAASHSWYIEQQPVNMNDSRKRSYVIEGSLRTNENINESLLSRNVSD